MAGDKIHRFKADQIEVQYSLKRCIHAEECVRRLGAVFDKRKRPWIQPANASADDVAAMIPHCPTGALHYARSDGGAPEVPDADASIHPAPDGPLYVRGTVTLKSGDGTTLIEDTRIALCRCGASKNKPFCDNSHLNIDFKAGAASSEPEQPASGVNALTISAEQGGPYHIEGDFTLYDGEGAVLFRGHEAWLCRCGSSEKKPFCDSTHKKIGFDAP